LARGRTESESRHSSAQPDSFIEILLGVYFSRAMARQPMSRRQNPPGHLILSIAA
jgi:hypothetical protein